MAADLIRMFGVSLIVTLAVELAAAFLLGVRFWKGMALVFLVNTLTNPPAVLLYWLSRLYLPEVSGMAAQMIIEIAVVAAEALVYCRFVQVAGWRIKRPVLLSVIANVCSWTLGLLL